MFTSEHLVGKILVGRYRIETLRSDSTATTQVCHAYDLRKARQVALRLITTASLVDQNFDDESTALDSFKASMQQLSVLSHPTLVKIEDWGDVTVDGVRYAFNVTEFYGHGTLREFLDRTRRLTPSQALVVGIDVCRALHHVHQNGFVHSDIRPANLIFGADARVRLAGLGTKRISGAQQMSIEQARYAAPEIGLGSSPDAQTDIYSLALTLLESVTGEVPFVGESVAITLANRVEKLLPVTASMGPIAAPIERAARPVSAERGTALELGRALALIADKLPRPQPIDTIVPKKFEDVITRPNPITSTTASQASPLVLDQGTATAKPEPVLVPESARTRKRFIKLWSVVALTALVAVGVVTAKSVSRDKYQIPALAGLAESEARNALAVFDIQLLIRAERTNDVEFGHVIRTEPGVGDSIAQGKSLVLFVSEGPPLGVLVDVTGQSRTAATSTFVDQGLIVAVQEEPSDTTPIGNVISWTVAQQPSLIAGDEVLQGTMITLVVSTGPALRAVPLIVGMTLDAASTVAADLGLVLVVSPESFSNDATVGLIGAQSPPPGQLVPRDSSLVYSISLGPDLVELPNIVGINFIDAEKRLLDAGFVVGQVTGRKPFRMKSASISGVEVNNHDMVLRGSVIDMVFP